MCLISSRHESDEDLEFARPARKTRPIIYETTRPTSSRVSRRTIVRKPPMLKTESMVFAGVNMASVEQARRNRPPTVEAPEISVRLANTNPPQYMESSIMSAVATDTVASSSRSRSDSIDSSPYSLKERLREKLRRARREMPLSSHSFFVPDSSQKELITVETIVRDIQNLNEKAGEDEVMEWAKKACKSARKLYAVLALINKEADVGKLLEENVTDESLPFRRVADDGGAFRLLRRNGEPIETLELWREHEREQFDRVQWWMLSPIFEDRDHYELDDKTILPFLPIKDAPERKQGGYSEVFPVRIHPAHHTFWKTGPEDHEPLIAVKQLFSSDKIEFEKEATVLKALGHKQHPHLIRLLATYRLKMKYHIMFPYANANLRKYWEDRPCPAYDKETVLWSMKQMTGLANALMLIHNFRVTHPLSVAGAGRGAGGKRIKEDVELSVVLGEEFFGRHGDIKPENVLWFKDSGEGGVLQIADFGLGRFHGRDSRSNLNPDTVFSSPTYEPPECKLRRPVSRAYDIWSLGCLYLEFVTWLLKGSDEIDGFADFRGRENSTGINDDNFFTLTRQSTHGIEAVVRENVILWVHQLHGNEKCSEMIHDVLDLIMKDLLVVDSRERSNAAWLYHQLEAYLRKAQSDLEYLLKPAPRESFPQVSSVSKREKLGFNESLLQNSKNNFTARAPKDLTPKAPRDLVLRKLGSRGVGASLTRNRTWPPS